MTDLSPFRLVSIELDERFRVRRTRAIEEERQISMGDLLELNSFTPAGSPGGPYQLTLSMEEKCIIFDIRLEDGTEHRRVSLSLAPFRRVIREYFSVYDRFYKAIRTETPEQIDRVDTAKRGLHDEGATLLCKRLHRKIEIDFETARRMFTVIVTMMLAG